MHVTGGLYLELCSIPQWRGAFGSGGRAAAAIAAFSKQRIQLHTYADTRSVSEAAYLQRLNIDIRASHRPHGIAFSYLHPLSTPFLTPRREDIARVPPIKVEGDAVLRFGFIEGDAMVRARRAVYDPQTWRDPQPFSANGSVADELAVVLNALELRQLTGIDDLYEAAATLLAQENVSVVIAKQGIAGSLVTEKDGRAIAVPAFRSERVFKIGTGDVFSSVFSYLWAHERMSAARASEIASRSVAQYCESGALPIQLDKLDRALPLGAKIGRLRIVGEASTLGRRYVMDEALFVLRDLGVRVISPDIDDQDGSDADATLIIADGLEDCLEAQLEEARKSNTPVVVFREDRPSAPNAALRAPNIRVTDDFCSAMFLAAWATAQ